MGLTDHLDTAQKADMRAYMSLITNVLGNAEVLVCVLIFTNIRLVMKCPHTVRMQAYITWLDPVTLNEVTKPRYGSVYPWPLNTVLTYLKVS